MTVGYNRIVANSSGWTMLRLLLKWRGSIWKAVWKELLIWIFLFGIISVSYRCLLTPEQQLFFERLAVYFHDTFQYIPLDFMLGFFVVEVVHRWVNYFNNIGILDNVSLLTSNIICGTDDKIRQLRRNIVRYCVLSQTLVFRDISLQVRKRFPTLDTVVGGRFMMPHEKVCMESIKHTYGKYWMPFSWAMDLATKARAMGAIQDDFQLAALVEEIKTFRTQMANLCNYDWVPLPIMYPQLICIAVHVYFFVALFARQFLNDDKLDTYIPFMSIIQFVLYVGWLKIAEALMNPMGEDDDDFECNWLIDRNLKIGLTIVDEGYECAPEMIRDEFWGNNNQPLYAENSRPVRPLIGSTANITPSQSLNVITMVELDNGHERKPSRGKGRRVSLVPINNSLTVPNTPGIFTDMRRRMSRFNSKPSSSNTLSEMGLEKVDYATSLEDDAFSTGINSLDARSPHSPEGNSKTPPPIYFYFDRPTKQRHTMGNHHEIVDDTITEETACSSTSSSLERNRISK